MAYVRVMFSPSLDGGAPMSADERPFRLEKGEPEDRLETGWRCRRRRNEGLAPVREEQRDKGASPSLDLDEEQDRDGENIVPCEAGRGGQARGRLGSTPSNRCLLGVTDRQSNIFFPSFGRNALINLDSGKWIEIFGRILTLFGRASGARRKRSEAN